MYGIEVKNSGAQTQIDSTYINLMKYETGSVSLSSGYSTNVSFTNYSGGVPVIAFKLLLDPALVGFIYKSGGDWASFDVHHEPSIGTLDYIVWRDLPVSTFSGYGLAIYNALGNAVFNSNDPVMKLIGSFSGTSSNSGGSTSVSVQDADNNYFMLFPFSIGTYIYYANPPYYFHGRICRGIERIDSTTVNVINFGWDLGRSQISVADMSAWEDSFTVVELSL